MRIVETDNYDRDYPMEKFHLFPMPSDHAERIADILNELTSDRYYKVVDNDYVLDRSTPDTWKHCNYSCYSSRYN